MPNGSSNGSPLTGGSRESLLTKPGARGSLAEGEGSHEPLMAHAAPNGSEPREPIDFVVARFGFTDAQLAAHNSAMPPEFWRDMEAYAAEGYVMRQHRDEARSVMVVEVVRRDVPR